MSEWPPRCEKCGEQHPLSSRGCPQKWRVLGMRSDGEWVKVATGGETAMRRRAAELLDSEEERYAKFEDFKVVGPEGADG